jgi:CO/xanthine dehydrogenase Mo-binding subunit
MRSTGALAICFSVSACDEPGTGANDGSVQLGNRITVKADGTVDLHMGKVELGQGIGTALSQIAAAELGVAFERMRLINVDTDHSPDESYTFSSISIQQSGPRVRDAAARGRMHLLERAAKELGTEAGELSVVDGSIMKGKASTRLDYLAASCWS